MTTGTASRFSQSNTFTILPFRSQSLMIAVPFSPCMYQRGRLMKLLVPTSTCAVRPFPKVMMALKPSSTSSFVTCDTAQNVDTTG